MKYLQQSKSSKEDLKKLSNRFFDISDSISTKEHLTNMQFHDLQDILVEVIKQN